MMNRRKKSWRCLVMLSSVYVFLYSMAGMLLYPMAILYGEEWVLHLRPAYVIGFIFSLFPLIIVSVLGIHQWGWRPSTYFDQDDT